MTWTIAGWENQGDAMFVGVLDILAENARIEPTTPHDVDISVLAMSTYIYTRYVYLYLYLLCLLIFKFQANLVRLLALKL